MTESKQPQAWLEIHDEIVTAESLMAEVEARLQKRRAKYGRMTPDFPVFGYAASMPEPLTPDEAPTLFHHLRQLNRMAAYETTAVLVPTPATQLPIIGRLWQLIRSQAHNLILFYVNRAVAHSSRTSHHTLSTLNELVRQNQQQQQAIKELKAEVLRLRAKDES